MSSCATLKPALPARTSNVFQRRLEAPFTHCTSRSRHSAGHAAIARMSTVMARRTRRPRSVVFAPTSSERTDIPSASGVGQCSLPGDSGFISSQHCNRWCPALTRKFFPGNEGQLHWTEHVDVVRTRRRNQILRLRCAQKRRDPIDVHYIQMSKRLVDKYEAAGTVGFHRQRDQQDKRFHYLLTAGR